MTSGDLTYQKVDEDENGTYDSITITYCDKSATSVDIPAEIDGLPVTAIGKEAFASCKNLTSITIPDSVAEIGDNAFSNTPWLETKQAEDPFVVVNSILIDGTICSGDVEIPDSVTSIGNYAFVFCENITSITIPDSVTKIGYGAFYKCTGLTSITIPNSITLIGNGAFIFCENLTSITILNPDCEIYDGADTLSNGVIHGYTGSTAQAYAKKYGYMFNAIDGVKVQGDLSGDGTIDFLDLVNLSKLLLPGAKISDEQLAIADLNGNGKLDFLDLVALSKELLKNANK